MARAALRWTADDIGKRTGISRTTVSRFELGQVAPNTTTLTVLRQAFEAAGVEFIDGPEPGVKLKARPESDSLVSIEGEQIKFVPHEALRYAEATASYAPDFVVGLPDILEEGDIFEAEGFRGSRWILRVLKVEPAGELVRYHTLAVRRL